MILKANAKINKYLKVVGKRADGYHELETLMIPINIYDVIKIENDVEDDCVCKWSGDNDCYSIHIEKENNLAYRVLKLLKKKFDIVECAKITIEKNIPIYAGVGGGSSDAAFVLKGLNEYWRLGLNKRQMLDIALEIGSDVPFFIENKPAVARGRGELLENADIGEVHGVLVFDNLRFSTKEIFDIYDNLCEKRKEEIYSNDLEKAVETLEVYDRLRKVKLELIEKGCKDVSMTGSGSAIFGICTEKEEAEKIANDLKGKYWKVFAFENIKK